LLNETRSPAKISVLIAYPYLPEPTIQRLAAMGDRVRFLLDSGAFTAWKQGEPISLDDYCAFIRRLPIEPWGYLTLDVIGDPIATERNYQTMLDRGFRPIPIVTRGATIDDIDRYYETSEVVGLGGVTDSDKGSYAWVKAVMKHIGVRRKAHILGFTSMDWLKYCRPYSADSSSWLKAARYGKSMLYLGQGRFKEIARSDMQDREPAREVVNRIREFGFDPFAMQQAASWEGNRSMMSQLCGTSWLACSIEMERAIGTILFLALANDVFLRNLADAYELLTASHPEYL
jgi:hypothetical protein